jgi:calcineurin-like phosphoesterase family protein
MKIKDIQFDKDKLFFTSDTHFYHNNIIKYCNRPFTSVRDMNKVLVDNWNAIVPVDAHIFHLGDVSLTANPKELNDLLHSLNGTKHLVIGNHEKDALSKSYIKEHWTTINDIAEIYVKDEEITYGEQHLVMCHYPFYSGSWNGGHRGSWNLYGHVHGGLSNKGIIKTHPAQLDVGVDSHGFKPVSYQKVKELITKQMLSKQ